MHRPICVINVVRNLTATWFGLVLAVFAGWLAMPVDDVTGDEFDDAIKIFSARHLSADELQEGWIELFDGESLYGWRNEGDADFEARDGVIVASRGSEPCLLRTTTQFADYRLRVEFLSAAGTNSGIFLHTPPVPANPAVDCYELNIADPGSNPFPTGSLVGRELAEESAAVVRWQSFDVLVTGGVVEVKLDGETVMRYRDERPLGRGFIGLQFNAGRIAFGNVFLQPLELNSIYNGIDLTGWRTHPELDGEFAVDEEGDLSVKGGRGQLETSDAYGDFVMQLACRTNAPGLNSGIFFRCIPGEIMNGYESQIHNGRVDGDRARPLDCGTGGIFRRQDARRVVADDEVWFYKTVIAEGPHVAVWVNGVMVCDWTDKRRRDENPRRGLRTEAGTIMIQAHDETTDISFRDLRVGEMGRRNR